MPNLVGIGNSQVPTNAMLGGLAYQDPAHANLTSVEIENIAAIKAKLNDTATCIFVYDTRKDSDGGAWRKRTRGTSWYNAINEEGYQHIRGSRREFPSVAVIVGTTTGVSIYDGDDPNLSLWMKFKGPGSAPIYTTPQSLAAINGTIFVGSNASPSGAYFSELAFIHDAMRLHQDSGKNQTRDTWMTGMTPTAEGSAWTTTSLITPINISNDYQLYDRNTNAIAVIVRPNARIDEVSGLPRPTIAVAMDTGVSIIHDDGSITSKLTTSAAVHSVQWMGPDRLVFNAPLYYGIYNNPFVHEQSGYISNTSDSNFIYVYGTDYDSWSNTPANPYQMDTTSRLVALDSRTVANSTTTGLNIRQLSANSGVDDNSGIVAGISTNSNTGWMFGDIKVAYLANTNSDNVTPLNYNEINDTFVIGGTGNWSATNSWTDNDDGTLTCDGSENPGQLYIQRTGWRYSRKTLTFTVDSYTSGSINISFHTGSANSDTITVNSTGTWTYQPEAGVTGNDVIYIRSVNFVGTISSPRVHAERDYSTESTGINRQGLRVIGEVVKEPVASGAELMAYGPLNQTKYFEEPYNSELDFGTGDLCMMGWFYDMGTSTIIVNRLHNSTSTGVGYIVSLSSTGTMGYSSYTSGFQTSGRTTHFTSDVWSAREEWNMFVCGKKDGIGYMYINGILKSSGANTNSHTDTTNEPVLRIGTNHSINAGTGGGKIALVRISGGFPTPEQIKKIYEDEKKLFEPDAKCTIYGTSDDIKAIAHDDSKGILHIGTSSGRSDFDGLCRINNTTTAVTTAISASDGFIAEQ